MTAATTPELSWIDGRELQLEEGRKFRWSQGCTSWGFVSNSSSKFSIVQHFFFFYSRNYQGNSSSSRWGNDPRYSGKLFRCCWHKSSSFPQLIRGRAFFPQASSGAGAALSSLGTRSWSMFRWGESIHGILCIPCSSTGLVRSLLQPQGPVLLMLCEQ